MMIDRLETRLQFASISGTIWNDADSSQTYDRGEKPRPDITVFLDENKNGSLDTGEPTTTTDSKGRYAFTGLNSGTYTIGTITDPEELLSTNVGKGGTTQGRFDIDIVGLKGATASVKAAFETAARRWESIIQGDIPDVTLSNGKKIDDIEITANVGPIDGAGDPTTGRNVLGDTYTQAYRKNGYLPYSSVMTFDSYDLAQLQAEGTLNYVILHEMGHALGFGAGAADNTEIWAQKGLIQNNRGRDPRFVGENAVKAYNQIFGLNNLSIPIENTGTNFDGSRNSHWKESALNEELMTSVLGADLNRDGQVEDTLSDGVTPIPAPLSNITVGSMADLGYTVNLNSGDTWNPTTHAVTFKTAVDLGGVAQERQVQVYRNDRRVGMDFGFRTVSAPTVGKITISPSPAAVNRDITLSASKVVDNNGTGIANVTFYRETNGEPGLQRNEDVAVGVATVASKGVYSTTFNTQGLSGTQTFYAVVTDNSGYVGKRTGAVVVRNIIPPQYSPQNLSVRQRSSSSVRFAFTDTSVDVDTYRIEVSTSRDFGEPVAQVINLSGDTKITTITGLRAGVTYYVHVRGSNSSGVSPYSQTLSFETR